MQFNTTDSLKDLRAYCTENNIDVSGNKRAKQSYLDAIYNWQSGLKPVLPVHRKYLKISNKVEADITDLEQYEAGFNYMKSLINKDPSITVIKVNYDENGITPTRELTIEHLMGPNSTIKCNHVFLYSMFVNPTHSTKLTTDICDELEANNIDGYWLNEFRHGTTSIKYVTELYNEYGDCRLSDITWKLLYLNRAISAYDSYTNLINNQYYGYEFLTRHNCYPLTFPKARPYSILYIKKYFEKNAGQLDKVWLEIAKEVWKPLLTTGQVMKNPSLVFAPTYTRSFKPQYDKRILAKQITVKDILENPHIIARSMDYFECNQKIYDKLFDRYRQQYPSLPDSYDPNYTEKDLIKEYNKNRHLF